MHSPTFSRLQRQRGYSLMEILVAVAIFATVMIVALLLYDQSNRVFKRANESAEMQQNARVAFEKVVSDLRMAGFDYKRAGTPSAGTPSPWAANRGYSQGTLVTPTTPNGHVYRCITSGVSGATEPSPWPTTTGGTINDTTPPAGESMVQWQEIGSPVYEQPDEQIEYAHEKAITIRANFDYEDPTTTDHGRETELEKSSGYRFPVVTTGNDEIVTYALVSRSSDANANKDTISYYADVQPARESYPGGKVEKEIKITGVDLTNKYPPYTLMRYSLDANGVPVGTALADNIRSMEFKYWQDSAAKDPLSDLDDKDITDMSTVGGLGQYNPASPTNLIGARVIRGKIRAVTVSIVGMNPQPDYDYTHPTDTVAKNYRQFALQSTIVGRNLGLKGIPQTDNNPPDPPTLTQGCTGYCGVALLTWAPAPGSGELTYTILYDTSPTGSFSSVLPAGTQTTYAVDLAQLDLTKTYYFRVAATNDAGTTVSEGDALALNLKNVTKPNPPTIDDVTVDTMANQIQVTWTPPTDNATGLPSCNTGTTDYEFSSAEIKGYRVYRSKDSGFDPEKGEGTLVADENSSLITATGGGQFKLIDTGVANCEKYYYRVAAVEWCAAKGEYNTSGSVSTAVSDYTAETAGSALSKEKPKAPTNFKKHVESVCNEATNRCDPVTLLWDKVTKDEKENDIVVEQYTVKRQQKKAGVNVGGLATLPPITDGATTITDNTVLAEHDTDDVKFEYEYTVYATQCGVDGDVATLVYPGACVTGATIKVDASGPGSGTADDPVQDATSLTAVPYPSKPFTSVQLILDGGSPVALADPYQFDFDIQDGETHSVAFEIKTADCTETLVIYVKSDPAVCAVRAAAYNTTSSGQIELQLTNISGEELSIDDFDIQWTGQAGYSWQSITLPSGTILPATTSGSETTSSARTVTFDPTSKTDVILADGDTYTILLTFIGAGFPLPSSVGAITVNYHQGSATTQFGCSPTLVTCGVNATVAVTNPSSKNGTYDITLTNNSPEDISVSSFSIRWNGNTDWNWDSVTVGSETLALSPVVSNGPATKTFTPSAAITVKSGEALTMVMNMDRQKGSAANLATSQIGEIFVDYTTPTSEKTTLTCRAK